MKDLKELPRLSFNSFPLLRIFAPFPWSDKSFKSIPVECLDPLPDNADRALYLFRSLLRWLVPVVKDGDGLFPLSLVLRPTPLIENLFIGPTDETHAKAIMGTALLVWNLFPGGGLGATVAVFGGPGADHLSALRAKDIHMIEMCTELRFLRFLENGHALSRDKDWEEVGVFRFIDLQDCELESVFIAKVEELGKGVANRQFQFPLCQYKRDTFLE